MSVGIGEHCMDWNKLTALILTSQYDTLLDELLDDEAVVSVSSTVDAFVAKLLGTSSSTVDAFGQQECGMLL